MGVAAMLGSPIKRREDPRLITGQATYVDDIKLHGLLHMAVLRSPYGHARINSINTEAARTHPGVMAVYTAEDLKGAVGNIAIAVPLGKIAEGMGNRGALAEGKVRFYGDPVAVVIADDRYTARDAKDLIEVDYEPLPAAIDLEKAMQPDAPILYEEFGTNVAFSMHPPTDEIDKVFEQTLAEGGVVVKQRMVNQRVAPVPMETRGVLAEYRKSDKTLTVWSSSQIPHLLRNILSALVGLPQHQVRVIVPEVGGGFGCKLNVYPEELETHYSQSPFIKEICILGLTEAGGEILHAIVVPDMDEFRRRGQTAMTEMIRFEIENLSRQVPSFYRIHSISIRNELLPRTVTRRRRFALSSRELPMPIRLSRVSVFPCGKAT